MRSLTQINRWLHATIATLAVWSQGYVHALFDRLSVGRYWLLGTVAIVIVGIQASDRLCDVAINRARWLRRIIMGHDDIEGDWVNIVVSTSDPGKILATEYGRIRYKAGTYVLSGDTWSLDGKWIGNYVTTGGATYKGRQAEYYYKTGISQIGGFGVIMFQPSDGPITNSMSRYIDETTKCPYVTSSRRVSTKLRTVSMDERRDAALTFARAFDQEGLLHLRAVLGDATP